MARISGRRRQYGYIRFNPASLDDRQNVLPVAITYILVFNRPLEKLDPELRWKISKKAAGYTEKISLPYRYNNFSIEFAMLNYLNPQQSKYAYKLDGYDREWQYADASKTLRFVQQPEKRRLCFLPEIA